MPKLNEYIGSIVSSITNARVMSDIQTVKVAEDYSRHELLKHFSVPRMRIDDVEMTIPIALDEVQERTKREYEPIDNKRFNSIVYKEIVNSFGLASLPRKISGIFQSEIAQRTQALEQHIRVADDLKPLNLFSKEMAIFAMKMAENYNLIKKDIIKGINIRTIQSKLEQSLAGEIKLATEHTAIDNLNVIVEAHKLREQKPENIIYVKLRITEDGMEWNRTEDSTTGEVESRLLPE